MGANTLKIYIFKTIAETGMVWLEDRVWVAQCMVEGTEAKPWRVLGKLREVWRRRLEMGGVMADMHMISGS
eukprot:6255254-Prorocentrum_lima.AAC.1